MQYFEDILSWIRIMRKCFIYIYLKNLSFQIISGKFFWQPIQHAESGQLYIRRKLQSIFEKYSFKNLLLIASEVRQMDRLIPTKSSSPSSIAKRLPPYQNFPILSHYFHFQCSDNCKGYNCKIYFTLFLRHLQNHLLLRILKCTFGYL